MQPPVFKDQSPEKLAARMRAAFEMYEDGVWMLKQRIARESPHLTGADRLARMRMELERPIGELPPPLKLLPWPPSSKRS